MPHVDIAVAAGVVGGTFALGFLLRRQRVHGRRFMVSLWTGFFGLALLIAMAAHCLDILSRLLIGSTYAGAPISYDFRVYSLMLLGAVLMAFGAGILRASLRLGSGDPLVARGALRLTAAALLVVVPLIPIHAVFAIPLTVMGAATLLALVVHRTGAADEHRETVTAVPGADHRVAPV